MPATSAGMTTEGIGSNGTSISRGDRYEEAAPYRSAKQ
jgi:hypothetical protein